jgi:hypothetical protein
MNTVRTERFNVGEALLRIRGAIKMYCSSRAIVEPGPLSRDVRRDRNIDVSFDADTQLV